MERETEVAGKSPLPQQQNNSNFSSSSSSSSSSSPSSSSSSSSSSSPSSSSSSSSSTSASSSSSSNVTAFLSKLWRLVNEYNNDDLISWSQSGCSFVILNQIQFAKDLLPLYFKHSNMASFIRQLNMYGFRKIPIVGSNGSTSDQKTEVAQFYHVNFMRGQEQRLASIKRKNNSCKTHNLIVNGKFCDEVRSILSDVKSIRDGHNSSESILRTIQVDNKSLWRDISVLRSQHHKQRRVIEKLIQFLLSLLQNRNNIATKKRKVRLMINTGASNDTDGSGVDVDNACDDGGGHLEMDIGYGSNGSGGADNDEEPVSDLDLGNHLGGDGIPTGLISGPSGMPLSPQDAGSILLARSASTAGSEAGGTSGLIMGSAHDQRAAAAIQFAQTSCNLGVGITTLAGTGNELLTSPRLVVSSSVGKLAPTLSVRPQHLNSGSSTVAAVTSSGGQILRNNQSFLSVVTGTGNGGSQQQQVPAVTSTFVGATQHLNHLAVGRTTTAATTSTVAATPTNQLQSPRMYSGGNSENINHGSNGSGSDNQPQGYQLRQLPMQFNNSNNSNGRIDGVTIPSSHRGGNLVDNGGGSNRNSTTLNHVTQWTANSIYNTMTDHGVVGGGVFADLRSGANGCLDALDSGDPDAGLGLGNGSSSPSNNQYHQHHHQQPQHTQHQSQHHQNHHHHHQQHHHQNQQQHHQQQQQLHQHQLHHQHHQQPQQNHLHQQHCFYS